MKKRFYIIGLFVCFNVCFIFAQEEVAPTTEETEEPSLTISGSADVYFRANLNADFAEAPGTSFGNLPGFSLGMANFVIAQEGTNFGFTADLVFGPRGEDATFLSPFLRPGGNSSVVNQLFAYWNVSDAVTLTIGNFNTFLGYEVISPASNFNYSTSYMFSYGPFSHTGLKADFDLGSGFSLMAGVFNPTDATEYNPSNDYVGGAQLGYEFDKGSVYLNTIYAPSGVDSVDAFTQFDITAGFDVTDDLYLGVNATTASESFVGYAAYVQYSVSDDLALGVRAESFTDKGIELLGTDESVFDLTFSANYSVGNLTLIPEFRLDAFSQDVIATDGGFSDSLSSFMLAAVYGF